MVYLINLKHQEEERVEHEILGNEKPQLLSTVPSQCLLIKFLNNQFLNDPKSFEVLKKVLFSANSAEPPNSSLNPQMNSHVVAALHRAAPPCHHAVSIQTPYSITLSPTPSPHRHRTLPASRLWLLHRAFNHALPINLSAIPSDSR